MTGLWRRLCSLSALWSSMAVVVAGIVAVATVVTRGDELPPVVDNPLVFANGALVPEGSWSVLCFDGVAYPAIASPGGHAVLPKVRKSGLIERCALPAGD